MNKFLPILPWAALSNPFGLLNRDFATTRCYTFHYVEQTGGKSCSRVAPGGKFR